MELFWILSIDQDKIYVDYNKDIKLLSKDLVDIVLKTGGCIRKTKKHYLVLKVALSGMEGRLPLVAFSDFYLIIGTGKI